MAVAKSSPSEEPMSLPSPWLSSSSLSEEEDDEDDEEEDDDDDEEEEEDEEDDDDFPTFPLLWYIQGGQQKGKSVYASVYACSSINEKSERLLVVPCLLCLP
jgi:hypothetical protein